MGHGRDDALDVMVVLCVVMMALVGRGRRVGHGGAGEKGNGCGSDDGDEAHWPRLRVNKVSLSIIAQSH